MHIAEVNISTHVLMKVFLSKDVIKLSKRFLSFEILLDSNVYNFPLNMLNMKNFEI